MVQNNKVLTVSYGTFSCTLEGFEDSFGTMKAIAEYFRDLAADDRYFGAEPPQPDADMLARIAQREIARQVEARTSDSGIHLRAAEVAAVAAPAAAEAVEPPVETPAPAEAAAPVAEPIEDIAEEAKAEPVSEPVAEPVAEAEVVPPVAPRPGADSIAAKLQRIRAVVSKVPAPEEEEFSEDQHADTEVDEAIAEISAALAEDDQVEEAVDDDGGEADDQAEIARVLSRIDSGEAAEDEVAASPVAELEEDLAEPVSETPADTAEDTTTDDSDLMAAVSRSMADSAPAAEPAAAEAETAKADTPEPAPAEEPRQRTRIVRIKRAHLNELRNQAAAELELRDSPDAAPKADPKADVQPEPKPETVAEDTPAAPPAPAPAVAEAAPAPEAPETHLSEDDEADLLRELAAVEAELLGATGAEDDSEDDTTAEAEDDTAEDDGDAETAVEDTPAEVAEVAEPVRPKRPSREAATRDSDISRLMAAADEKLGDPETSSSRETYSHMRAAVAAAQAEKSAGGSLGSEDQVEAYREDLANVVKPRRPSAEGRRAQPRPTPAASRPAPLKLVAAQRIDQDLAPKPSGPVRPRRIAAVTEDDSAFDAKGSEGGFKAFAQEQGAVELHELLEAAASYMSFVEGREHFSRPQLMNKVRQVDGADFNREDGLRHFGTLLREGKIERSGNGQFTASGQIGFQPDERAAG